jgi:hypothetical protein
VLFRIVNGVMVLLFALAVGVQYNDPDRIRWMAIYGAALVVSLIATLRGEVPMLAAAAVGGIALAWAIYWAATSDATAAEYGHMFDEWEMKNAHVEEAREATGLLIVAFWMAIVAAFSRWLGSGTHV